MTSNINGRVPNMAVLPKPKRGQCGTCQFFEMDENFPMLGGYHQGQCCVAPPKPLMVMQQAPPSALVNPTKPQGPQMQQGVMGLRPPTVANARCFQWWPAGVDTPAMSQDRNRRAEESRAPGLRHVIPHEEGPA